MYMQYGICTQATVPVRETPSHKSQMINQLLFGDLIYVKELQNGWALTETFDDKYEGWVEIKQITQVTKEWVEKASKSNRFYVNNLCSTVTSDSESIPVTFGATLYFLKENNFFIDNKEYQFYGDSVKQETNPTGYKIVKTAKRLLNAPYLWGGRSPFGFDCSGFTQVVFKLNGVFIDRDASQQVTKGEEINFVEESKDGDLAFFGSDEGEITHVGIMIGNNKIIHASGKVKIDSIDHHGIFDKTTKEYSHKLRIIKRLV